jgi:hypothetical protein
MLAGRMRCDGYFRAVALATINASENETDETPREPLDPYPEDYIMHKMETEPTPNGVFYEYNNDMKVVRSYTVSPLHEEGPWFLIFLHWSAASGMWAVKECISLDK